MSEKEIIESSRKVIKALNRDFNLRFALSMLFIIVSLPFGVRALLLARAGEGGATAGLLFAGCIIFFVMSGVVIMVPDMLSKSTKSLSSKTVSEIQQVVRNKFGVEIPALDYPHYYETYPVKVDMNGETAWTKLRFEEGGIKVTVVEKELLPV